MSVKIDRLNNMFVEEISKIIHEEIKNKDVGFVTITDTRITNDLSFAKVYITTLDTDRDKVLNALNKSSGFIRSLLCDRVKIRKMPEKPGNNKGYSTEKLELGIAIFTVIMYSIPKWSKME